jgi:hypothetical protein
VLGWATELATGKERASAEPVTSTAIFRIIRIFISYFLTFVVFRLSKKPSGPGRVAPAELPDPDRTFAGWARRPKARDGQ